MRDDPWPLIISYDMINQLDLMTTSRLQPLLNLYVQVLWFSQVKVRPPEWSAFNPIVRKALVLTRDIDHSPHQHRWGPCPSQIWQKNQSGPIQVLASIHHECTWILEFLLYNQLDSKCPTAYSFPYQNNEHSSHTWGRFVHWGLQISTRKWHYYINHFFENIIVILKSRP